MSLNTQKKSLILLFTVWISLCLGLQQPYAESFGKITGHLTDATTREPISGVNVILLNTRYGTLTNAKGSFSFPSVPPGLYSFQASRVGYRPHRVRIHVSAEQTQSLDITLQIQPIERPGIEVSVLRPDLQTESRLTAQEVRETRVRDSGELLRSLPGVDAIRRGPVGLDPSVRGLRETEVGVYIDGTRTFPAGPARMDSPFSHFDPSAVHQVQVVKGPYALTWGAGNLSAIRVHTLDPTTAQSPFQGQIRSGYDSNLDAFETAASIYGRQEGISYWLHGAWREGNDYTSGSGTIIPADFKSRETRGKISFLPTPESSLTFSGGFQRQDDIDYPGRLLNAEFFEAYNFSAEWRFKRWEGPLRSLHILAYVNNVDHGMTNADKPTAQPNPNRMPPFPLDVKVDTRVNVKGGRLAAEFAPGTTWLLELGGDLYRANRDANRQIFRADMNRLIFNDIVWPDANLTDAGLFVRTSGLLGTSTLQASGTLRLDFVNANAGTVSPFFGQNTTVPLDQSETNISGAFTLSLPLNTFWSASLGVGSAVRTADASERYSDRFPASKSQMPGEFMGNPGLDPERNTQIDLWLEAVYPTVSFQLNGFFRRINDYISFTPTGLPRRLPLSPPTVFRYLNGDAEFRGFESALAVSLAPPLTLKLGLESLWGKDKTQNEPVIGVSPIKARIGLRYEVPRYFLEGTLQGVGEQNRVAASRGEIPTDGYITADLKAGIRPLSGLELLLGVTNLADKAYINHLNAKNPFTRQPIAEPGRVLFAHIDYGF